MQAIAVMNQKGGVGKTTTTLNLSYALSQKDKKILVVDLDPQAHLTAAFGMTGKVVKGVADVLLDNENVNELLVSVNGNLELLPAGEKLGEMEHVTTGGVKRGMLLHDALLGIEDEFDYIFIDCPPSSGILGMNALFAVNKVIIPVSGDFFSLNGLSRLMNIFGYIEDTLQKSFDKWVVLTRFHERRKLAREVKERVVSYFPGHVYSTHIRESVGLAESPGFGQTIFEYKNKSNGAIDYCSLADDVIYERVMN